LESRPISNWRCDGRFERELRRQGYAAIAGIDEAGRGAWFGPVFAAAVILPEKCGIRGLRDSKQLSADTRERLALEIRACAVGWAVAQADAGEIDRLNIYQASRLAMQRAVHELPIPPDFLLVDAMSVDVSIPQRGLIHGDARVHSIAAASILAKVHRDAAMREWDAVYPQYGLARGKGYGTPQHRSALEEHGPSPQHRLTFEPIRRVVSSRQLSLELALGAEAGW
jgi:ribonuclease HII